MHSFLRKIAVKFIAPIIIAALSAAGYAVQPKNSHPVPAPTVSPHVVQVEMPNTAPVFGATNAIETPVALFQTSLANGINPSATSMTLVNGTTGDGTSLASSTYSFIIDEGTASAEFVKADCTGTVCTNMQRGISTITGTSTVAALAKQHRRGASVKITDAPLLLNLTNIINGVGTFPNVISYTSGTACTASSPGTALCSKSYSDQLSYAGTATSTESTTGISRLATQLQTASSTDLGANTPLVLQAKYATSTYSTTTSALRVPITQNNGFIDLGFMGLTRHWNFQATTTIPANSTTSKPLILNGIPYAFPAAQATSSSLVTNGAGTLNWQNMGGMFHLDVSPNAISGSTASTTVFQHLIPANLLGTRNALKITIPVEELAIANPTGFYVEVGYGTASTTKSVTLTDQSSFSGNMVIYVSAAGTTSSQEVLITYVLGAAAATVAGSSGGVSFSQTATSALPLTVVVRLQGAGTKTFNTSLVTGELLVNQGI